ncbi:hypothetical protein DPEC_G00072060 [Dallia pectoralis]|uniref:Uncharacterized protein n=1 Tax=Dallia pectoralis TaxID=75939 RepID=A0ACC2H2K8_DALPE|nr:hypothetical protein DPEC_G00072060 [Dallia pectoralis]
MFYLLSILFCLGSGAVTSNGLDSGLQPRTEPGTGSQSYRLPLSTNGMQQLWGVEVGRLKPPCRGPDSPYPPGSFS